MCGTITSVSYSRSSRRINLLIIDFHSLETWFEKFGEILVQFGWDLHFPWLFGCFYCLAFAETAFADTESFLFTLVNPAGKQAVKISPKSDGGIRCSRSRGPVFGNKSYFDLKIWDGNQSGLLELGYGFNCPSSGNKTSTKFFTGNHCFAITELEVYELDF